jgi:tetratricopeptide (TPR) repeat protein
MIIATGEPTGVHWKDILLDLRVEDHPEPLEELKRLIRIHRAYEHANRGDLYVELDRIDEALIEYEKAAEFYPENPELPYWTAVSLADVGRLEEALPIFKDVFERFPDLRTLTPRLVRSGLLPNDPNMINTINSQ